MSENAQKVDILAIDVADQDTALRVLINFLEIANRRGAFSIAENAKIHECIGKFTQPADTAAGPADGA